MEPAIRSRRGAHTSAPTVDIEPCISLSLRGGRSRWRSRSFDSIRLTQSPLLRPLPCRGKKTVQPEGTGSGLSSPGGRWERLTRSKNRLAPCKDDSFAIKPEELLTSVAAERRSRSGVVPKRNGSLGNSNTWPSHQSGHTGRATLGKTYRAGSCRASRCVSSIYLPAADKRPL
jgi:hypothetical protein